MRDFLNKLRYRYSIFMQGRYGVDQLTKFLSYICIILVPFYILSGNRIFNILILFTIFVMYSRMFSKNFVRRYAENNTYLSFKEKLIVRYHYFKDKIIQSKKYHIYTCPNCGQKIRIPRGKGKISVHCTKCGHDFIKHS